MKERSGERSAACATCGKTFARSDTLLRHEKSHHTTEDRGPVHRVTNGTFRACSACATARSRCSGGSPCGRCNIRKIECNYPNKRRKGASPNEHTKVEGESPQPQMMGHFSQLVFAATEPSRFADIGHVATTSTTPTHIVSDVSEQPERSYGGQSGYPASYSNNNIDLTQNLNHPEQLVSISSMPGQSSQHDQFGDVSIAAQFQPGFGEPGSAYDYSSLDEPMNWIPVSIFPSPYDAELEHDFSFILPPLSETPNLGSDFNSIGPIETAPNVYQISSSTTQFKEQNADNQGFPISLMGIDQSPASSTSDGMLANRSTNGSSTLSDPKRKRRKSSFLPDLFNKPRNQKTAFAFPDLSGDPTPASLPQQGLCSRASYDIMCNAFQQLCVESNLTHPFESSAFPDISTINSCIDMHFEHFQPSFPLLHQPTFGPQTHWIVILATAAIGSTFIKAPYSLDLREAFQEFLRRAVHQSADAAADHHLDLSLAQARLLNLIGLAQSDRDQLRSLAPRYHADLSRWCLESGVLQLSESGDVSKSATKSSVWEDWEHWIRAESLRRVGYLTWLLDCSLAYMANARPLCNMDDARAPLPGTEASWDAETPEKWMETQHGKDKPPSLCAALETLYAKKAIVSGLSDLAQILLIHALYQRTWEVGTHIKQPLSEWVPTGKAQGFLNTPSKDNFWLPLYPLYANWRNSACDCLDFIHWQAASTVAKASGAEHGLILHLHLARIILLTPFQEIQDLLFSLVGKVGNASKASFYVHDGSYQPRNSAKLPQIRKITWRWLREDQHKARLAMIHAGSVFWHVRRYSSTSFYEPIAVYLASIVLWTYGSYKSAALERDAAANAKPVGGPSGPDADLSSVQPSRHERKVHGSKTNQAATSPDEHSRAQESTRGDSASESDSESTSDQPEFIHLDRPVDDEMVQHFVRNGHNMSGHMSNVGDICKMPQKVLIEGAKLLRTRLSCWGVSREYYDILTRLAELRKA